MEEKRGDGMTYAGESSSFNRKDDNDSSLKPESFDVMGTHGMFTSRSSWSQGLPQVFTDKFEGNSVSGCVNPIASFGPLCSTNYYADASRVMVEELTLNKQINSHLPVVDSSNNVERMQPRQCQWQQLFPFGGGFGNGKPYGVDARSKDKQPMELGGVGNPFQFCAQNPYTYMQPNQDCGSLMGRDINTASNNNLVAIVYPMMFVSPFAIVNPMMFVSPFGCSPWWFGNHNLKEEGVVLKQPEIHGRVSIMSQDDNNDSGGCSTRVSSDATLNSSSSNENVSVGCSTGVSSDATLNSSSGTDDFSSDSVVDNFSSDSVAVAADATLNSSSGTDNFSCADNFSSDSVAVADSAMSNDGISLRDWLNPEQQKINKVEKLYIFMQIVKFVDQQHSQEVALQDLRPSYFKLFPSNEIKYVGSLVKRGCLESTLTVQDTPNSEHNLSRKRYSEQEPHSNKNQKLNENMMFNQENLQFRVGSGFMCDIVKKIDSNIQEHDYGFDKSERANQYHGYGTWNKSGSPGASNIGGQPSTSLFSQIEEMWYASPMERNVKGSTSSNIYSLGILLFELFCCFESWQAHAATMSNLCYRILPPKFLSENPQEAGFCLWLLHPEPSSRPSAREVLQSELILEFQELSLIKKLQTSLDEDEDVDSEVLLDFLTSLSKQKEKDAFKFIEEIACLEEDVAEVEKRHFLRANEFLSTTHKRSSNIIESADGNGNKKPSGGSDVLSRFSYTNICGTRSLSYNIENAYFSMRSQIQHPDIDSITHLDQDFLKRENGDMKHKVTNHLGSFCDGLCKYARYSKFELRTTVRNTGIINSSNVICSLSFDRDEDYFAAAGFSKKIKIFEFEPLLRDSVDIYYPAAEMSSKSKLSCVTWNNYLRNYLVSSDYDGVVQLWDVNTGQGFSQFQEHEKRAWSVDFSLLEPKKFASGSDDYSVKLWSINEKKSIASINGPSNVCCVQFSPYSAHLLAFGGSDHKTFCFDIRNLRYPLCTLGGRGLGKSVSFVKFVDAETVVTANTDSTLRLWDLNKTSPDVWQLSSNACSLTFGGHLNQKNFVGLSVNNGYIACGSESNEVYAYYRSFPMPIASQEFGSIDPISGQETGDSNKQFVTSVCWRCKSDMVVAANSRGNIKVFQMR